ncbi:MAG: outer membrane lipid asymmetry maintenance protein MlaD [Desulfohalobiaceae bacterium]|nr:outer membrane lipid asymmetry maintenance protein MlaD [Desulfohalobiaceae bacterium]
MINTQRKIEILVGIFVLLCLVCVGYLTIQLGQFQLFSSDYTRYQARFSEVGGLVEGSAVRISGVNVGQVKDIRLDQERYAVIVSFAVEDGIKLSDDTMVSINTRGLIGDKFLSVSPGGSGIYLQPGDTIIDTQPPVNIQDLISKYAFGDTGDGE